MNTTVVVPAQAGYGCRIGTVGPVIVSVIEGRPELPLLDLLEKVQNEQVTRHKQVASLTLVTMDKLDAPAPEFRARAAAMQGRHHDAMICSAIVISSKGAAAVVARAFLAAYALLVKQTRPQQTFRDVASAIAWLKKQAPQLDELEGLTEAVEAFAKKQ